MIAYGSLWTEKAEASANITAFRTVPPNSWEPMGYNITGTAPYFITHTLNWSNTRIMGNLGIGDGSLGTLNGTSNRDVNYTDNNFMAADISMTPWDPGRLTAMSALSSPTSASGAVAEVGNAASTVVNENSSSVSVPGIGDIFLDIPRKVSFDNNTTQSPEIVANETTNRTAGNVTVPPGVSFSRPLNDPYHPVLMGRPVDDLLYEYPVATSINMYARLLGLRLPGGACVNMGIKSLGYGY